MIKIEIIDCNQLDFIENLQIWLKSCLFNQDFRRFVHECFSYLIEKSKYQ